MRKNPTIWRSWNSSTPLSLHRLQLRLLMRGLELLKPGGRLVYSTCSMNPIEDEAVIAGALKFCNGSVELVDTSSLLPGLKRTNGVNTWKVLTKNGEWISSYKETPSNLLHTVHSSMFPPTALEADTYQLNRWYFILLHNLHTCTGTCMYMYVCTCTCILDSRIQYMHYHTQIHVCYNL
ncbi:PREDICTED: tRNA (cytosine(34)-C(5))-methyltransferase-like [Amphimedon queenslandica]|uniref:SAM-dependent MTase RsmB/NOP-type domain-containing protein n=1 Tax=Amphimedon queenslandica TaxID=400682 RepID=A0AAN0JY91_AMPQE|nr:PREDICTED: tRNA (cytosine(34)-C(5))-methyltransferase-like [Amphimedon queenslandica]|eukprot:XP_019861924.1 PREDICTED: tRNA (cytosine(34)-C(5))-methyltransferase-like [Amphimedon queenslandica]